MLLENGDDRPIKIKIVKESDICESILLLYYYAFKGSLLNGLIHNIGSPLQSVLLLFEFPDLTSILGRGRGLEETVGSHISAVSTELKGLGETFEDFRMLEQMVETDERTLNIPDFFNLLSKILWADLFFKHNVKLSIKSDFHFMVPDVPSRIMVLVFVELVRNALKALRRTEGSRKLEFVLNVSEAGNKAIIGVGDSGCGWASNTDVSQLFEPYYSGWDPLDTYDSEIPSFGLGLYCIKELLSWYGGEVLIRRDSGTTWATLVVPFSEKLR